MLGPHSKATKSARYKASIGNPKVNKGCRIPAANCTSADSGKFTWTLNTIYSTGGLPYCGQRYTINYEHNLRQGLMSNN